MIEVIETFRNPVGYSLNQLKRDNPSCINGGVYVQKYRVTVELIPEDKEVYRQRNQKLWDECDNHHHWNPIQSKAKSMGIKLIGNAGSKRK